MDRASEDALWRSIVENYGDRAALDEATPAAGPTSDTDAEPEAGAGGSRETADPAGDADAVGVDGADDSPVAAGADHEAARERARAERAAEFEARHEVPDRFVPPDPGPLPYVAPRRLLAWAGVVGGPLLILLALVTGSALPGVVQLLAVAGFVGGFVYLVLSMPRDPRDPWDDGARV